MIDPTLRRTQFVFLFLGAAFFTFAWRTYGYFYNLSTLLSWEAWGDLTYHVQIFYGFLHGRPLQTSVYRVLEHGVTHTPFAYVSQTAIHVNFTPFLFAPLAAVFPGIYGVQALLIGLNFSSLLFFGLRLIKRLDPREFKTKAALYSALVLGSSFLIAYQYKGHLLMFATPFVLIAYECLQKRASKGFLLAILLLCGVSEDAALFAASFSIYILLFEQESRRLGLASLLLSLAYFALAVFVIQPASRFGLEVTSGSHFADAMKSMWVDWGQTLLNIKEGMRMWRKFFWGFPIALLLYPNWKRVPWLKVAGLIAIAPMSHWPTMLSSNAPHRMAPALACAALALALMIAHLKLPDQLKPHRFLRWAMPVVIALSGIYLYINYRVLLHNEPIVVDQQEHQLYRRFKAAVNQHVPRDRTLTLWCSMVLEGHLADRTDFWRFPQYLHESDFLAIQKNAKGWIPWVPGFKDLPFPEANERMKGSMGLSPRYFEQLTHEWVHVKKTHRILFDDEAGTILERLQPIAIPLPQDSIGLKYFRHIPAVLSGH